MRTTANRGIKFECAILTIMLGFSLPAMGETINDDLTVNGNLNVQSGGVFNGDLWGSKICGLNNICDPEKGATIDFKTRGSSTFGQEIVLTGGEGFYVGGSIRLTGGVPKCGSLLGSVILTGTEIHLDGNVKLEKLTGPANGSFQITGAKGISGGPTYDAEEGQSVVISGGKGGQVFRQHEWKDDGDIILEGKTIDLGAEASVTVASSMDLQGNELKNVRIEPCGGLLMGEFASE